MDKFINISEFMKAIFEDEKVARPASEIGQAILAAHSLRLTDISLQMTGKSDAAYKRIQRFLKVADPREQLWRLFQEEAEYGIGDPTEIERLQARKTAYVGTLKDGKSKGFWAMLLATPYRGRAIPCGVVTYSSKTIAAQQDSHNLNHFRAFEALKDLLGEKPLVLDREFSYLELLLHLMEEHIHFVIRLNLGSHPPNFFDGEGREVALPLSPGQTVIHNQIWYKGQACVNLIGTWKTGLSEPLWVITNLPAKTAQQIYFGRMKIEQSFRDLKSLLGMNRLMNKPQEHMQKMLALLLLLFSMGLWLGEELRDFLYGQPVSPSCSLPKKDRIPNSIHPKKTKKWKRYSGLFILLKQKWSLSSADQLAISNAPLAIFLAFLLPPVLTHV